LDQFKEPSTRLMRVGALVGGAGNSSQLQVQNANDDDVGEVLH